MTKEYPIEYKKLGKLTASAIGLRKMADYLQKTFKTEGDVLVDFSIYSYKRLKVLGIEHPKKDNKFKTKNNPYKVKVGQIWQDYDSRFRKQTPVLKKIISLTETHAFVHGIRNNIVISKSYIRLDRFKPNSTGYKLLGDNKCHYQE